MKPYLAVAMLAFCISLVGGLGATRAADEQGAPQPVKPIDAAQFYTGRWYEIARTPQWITKGCVAGTTDYLKEPTGRMIDRDACRDGGPMGKEKLFAGPVTILNPGQNTKVTVDYKVFGFFTVSRTYWMLDHGDDYGWFIASDPTFKSMNLFTRNPRPSPDTVKQLTAMAAALGYDVSKLEFPTQLPPGQS